MQNLASLQTFGAKPVEPSFREREEALRLGISSENKSVALTAAYLASSLGLALTGLIAVSSWASPILSSEGIIPNRVRTDRIGEILAGKYRVKLPKGFDFRGLLGQHLYRPALARLLESEVSFVTQRSRYVSQVDNFNQILVKVLFRRYKATGSILWRDVWASIDQRDLNRDFPTFANVAKRCHELRTSSPEPHPYSQTLGAFGREIRVGQRNRLVSNLRSAYQELVDNA